eukprot:11159399-Lingulodinium_polyedra.AAC.1
MAVPAATVRFSGCGDRGAVLRSVQQDPKCSSGVAPAASFRDDLHMLCERQPSARHGVSISGHVVASIGAF